MYKPISPIKVLGLVIFGDLVFVVLHIIFLFDYESVLSRNFAIYKDGSFAEIYQYVKMLCVVVLLLRFKTKEGSLLYAGWAVTFIILIIDDMLRFHENVGLLLSELLAIPDAFGLRGRDFGEVLAFGLYGVPCLICLSLLHRKEVLEKVKSISIMLFKAIIFLVLAGIVVDAIHEMASHYLLEYAFGLLEDGGEMIIVSCVLGALYNEYYKRFFLPAP